MDQPDPNPLIQTYSRRALLEARLYEAKARFRENTRYDYNGGTFSINPWMLIQWTDDPQLLIDENGLPVEILDEVAFWTEARRRWTSALRRFHLDVKLARETYAPDLFDACGE